MTKTVAYRYLTTLIDDLAAHGIAVDSIKTVGSNGCDQIVEIGFRCTEKTLKAGRSIEDRDYTGGF